MKITLLLATLVLLAGCSLMPTGVSDFEEKLSTAAAQSSERTLCRNIPVGTWLRLYGSSPERMRAWQALCLAPTVTPATP